MSLTLITTYDTNIQCTYFEDCGNCKYYYKCAHPKQYMINDREVTSENLDELKEVYKLSRSQIHEVRNNTK